MVDLTKQSKIYECQSAFMAVKGLMRTSGEAKAAGVLGERENKAEKPIQIVVSFNSHTGK